MHHHQQDSLHYFQFDALGQPAGLNHAVFSRRGGVSAAPFSSLNLSVSVPDDKANVYANRRRAYGLFGRDTDTVVHAHLVHETAVARVTQANNGTWLPRCDALITDEPGCALTMNYADCAPILLYDPVRRAIGLGHAGWRGTVADVPGAMVAAMAAEFGSDPANLLAAVGPSIGPCCYEVGQDVIDAVGTVFDDPATLLPYPANGAAAPENGTQRPHFDLPEANRRQLAAAGVPAQQIELAELCTACRTDLFFSHRAENGRTGRFGAILMLTQPGSGRLHTAGNLVK